MPSLNENLEKALIYLTLKLYNNLMIPRNIVQLFMVLLSDFINNYLKEYFENFLLIDITDEATKEKISKNNDSAFKCLQII